jgi:hypothetical protein
VTERRQRRVRFPVAIGSSDDSPILRRVELDGEEGGTEESWKAGRCMPVDGTRRPWHQSEEGRWQSRWCLGHKGDQSLATCEIFFFEEPHCRRRPRAFLRAAVSELRVLSSTWVRLFM